MSGRCKIALCDEELASRNFCAGHRERFRKSPEWVQWMGAPNNVGPEGIPWGGYVPQTPEDNARFQATSDAAVGLFVERQSALAHEARERAQLPRERQPGDD